MSNNYEPVCAPDPLSVYVPFESLTEQVIRSIISVALPPHYSNGNFSQRTLLIFLLAIDEKLRAIEKSADATEKQFDEHTIQHAEKVRRWLVDRKKEPLHWDQLRREYEELAKRKSDEWGTNHQSKDLDPYFELSMPPPHADVKRSRLYMAEFRKKGFQPEELKVYWNVEQLENLCPKEGEQSGAKPPHDPSDADAVDNLREHPVSQRNHMVKIDYVSKGIEKAVFDVPDNAQIIVLNFANEQSPGGGYLRNARAQEEIMLYNSDGYRALLDLKYGRMGGGYVIPEFGLAYVRNMRFFNPHDAKEPRSVDMLVSACYCLNGAELFHNPRDDKEWKEKNLAKFKAFIAAAVANTKGDGSNTYLLLGPIGTGAFGNDVDAIGEVFRDVLELKMMGSKEPIRQAFGNIWFVSTDKWKNDQFENILRASELNTDEQN